MNETKSEREFNMKMCVKCVLPEAPPNITLSDSGKCNLCIDFENESKEIADQKMLETDFLKLLEKYRGKGQYDCLVMCSGGKDSTSALYFMVKRYKMKTLAFTFDHGFETDEAMENVERAVDILGVDFLYFKSTYMKNLFGKLIKTQSKAVICHPCSIWYMQKTFDLASKFEIPIIVAGWTKGQSSSSSSSVMSKCACSISQPEFVKMGKATKDFIQNHVKTDPEYRDFPSSMEEMLTKAQKKHKAIVISPHWFLPFDQETYVDIIKKELNWEQPVLSYPSKSTNCELNFLSVHNSMENYGYTHYHVEMSKMIRQGLITREEALERLQFNYPKESLDKIKNKLGIDT